MRTGFEAAVGKEELPSPETTEVYNRLMQLYFGAGNVPRQGSRAQQVLGLTASPKVYKDRFVEQAALMVWSAKTLWGAFLMHIFTKSNARRAGLVKLCYGPTID